jgi:hypothetical protein
MIQLVEQPYETAFTRNPLIYRFRAVDENGALYAPIGVRSEIRVSTYHGPEEGETMTLLWTEPDGTSGSVTFTASTTPDAPEEIPAVVGVSPGSYPNWTSYYNAVGEKMKQHPVAGPLFKFYTVNRGGGQSFWAEALELDSNWTLTWDVSGIATPPTFEVVDTTTVTPSAEPENYRILWDLFLEVDYLSGQYDRVAQGEEFLNASSEAYLNLERILDAQIKTTLATPGIPEYSNEAPLLADNLRRYYIRYREAYDDIEEPSWTLSSVRRVILGGIAQNLFAQGDFLNTINEETAFLTWKPDNRTIGPSTKEYLAWYNYTGSTKNLVLEYRGTYADGSVTTAYYRYESPNVQALPGETVLFPVGYSEVGQDDDLIVSYKVRVIDRGEDYEGGVPTYLSKSRTYNLDRYYRESERTLMYRNGFGCPETLRCLGYATTDLSTDREDATHILEPGYAATTRERFQSEVSWRNIFTYRTGYLPKLELDSLQEMVIYNQVYEVLPEVYVPLFITNKDMAITETRQLLHALTIVAEPALQQRNYSNIMMDEANAGEFWLTNNGGNWLTIFGQPWQIV